VKAADPKTESLRERCVREALAIIEESGVEGLSLREVARRLNVSHQAPYKHFADRDHILAEIVDRTFAAFARHLDARPKRDNPHDDLAEMGRAYLEYARKHPLQYRLMFGTPLPDPHSHPAMMRSAQHAFSLLRECLRRIRQAEGWPEDPDGTVKDALFVWATMHGLSGIMQASALQTLELSPALLTDTVPHLLRRVGMALTASAPNPATPIRRKTHG
jgi:AcrR family transcriptional regulator